MHACVCAHVLVCVALVVSSVSHSDTGASAAASIAPRAIWSLFYNMELCKVNHELLEGTPTNLYITSDPTGSIVYEDAVAEVREGIADSLENMLIM